MGCADRQFRCVVRCSCSCDAEPKETTRSPKMLGGGRVRHGNGCMRWSFSGLENRVMRNRAREDGWMGEALCCMSKITVHQLTALVTACVSSCRDTEKECRLSPNDHHIEPHVNPSGLGALFGNIKHSLSDVCPFLPHRLIYTFLTVQGLILFTTSTSPSTTATWVQNEYHFIYQGNTEFISKSLTSFSL